MIYTNIFEPMLLIAVTLCIGFILGLIIMFLSVRKECRVMQKELDAKNKRDNKFLSHDV